MDIDKKESVKYIIRYLCSLNIIYINVCINNIYLLRNNIMLKEYTNLLLFYVLVKNL